MTLSITIAAVGLVVVLLCPARLSGFFGALTAVFLAGLIPSNTPPRDVILYALLGAVIVMFLGLLRSARYVEIRRTNPWIIAFVVVVTLRQLVEVQWPYSLRVGVTGAGIILVSVLASQEWTDKRGRERDLLVWSLPVLVIVEFCLAWSEEFGGAKALWPLSNGTDVIGSRYNTVLSSLPGRALGSTGQPIPLGALACAGLVVCIWLLIERRRYGYIAIAGLAVATLIFAGSRTAIIAAMVATLYLLLTRSRLSSIPLYLAGGGLLLIGLFNSSILDLLGFSDFSDSTSYSHRVGVLGYVPELLNRGSLEFLFGSGYTTIANALQNSSAGSDGITVFDQEYVRTAWGSGLLGLVLLAGVLISGWRRSDKLGRMLLIVMAILFASWDALGWNMAFTIFAIAASRYTTRREVTTDKEELSPNSTVSRAPTSRTSR
ncbi:hypothetical protein [Subtercola frigoramans]|uniref:O-antigen ligase domain-containing protein n=1 Tax=Subtercola frigoramans TaxID=120298 RepID=A0ABS2L8S5_9MICO|nr:hypothetical protein [Subtercola frigoramans]MBM7473424.1 hypothetical protein [Subtercola frigoramans]